MPKVLNERIIRMENPTADIFRMTVSSPFLSAESKPGQFLNIKCSEGLTPLLRRPLSICDVDRENCTVDIVFQVKGEGTMLISRKKVGENIDVMGPLGKPFEMGYKFPRIAVVGGGIGTFPLLFLLKESDAIVKRTYLGFRSTDCISLENEFREASNSLAISTDDGSNGQPGFVTDLFEKDINNSRPDMIYACGPQSMLKKIASIAEKHGIPCQISLEERMGCGIGACLVCACKTRRTDGDNELQYSHVCKDGPVFWSKDVIFD